MLTVAAPALNERQKVFLDALISGANQVTAAEIAGYSNPRVDGSRVANTPAVIAALQAGVRRSLELDVATNLRVLRKIRDDEAAPARVRADIGVKLMALAGVIQPTTREEAQAKPLSEMTQAELLEHIERNQAAIDKAEAELMAKAKDVTPAPGVADSVPNTPSLDAKLLDYLD